VATSGHTDSIRSSNRLSCQHKHCNLPDIYIEAHLSNSSTVPTSTVKHILWAISPLYLSYTRTQHFIVGIPPTLGSNRVSSLRNLHIATSELDLPHMGSHGGAVVEVLFYKPEGRGFDYHWCHWIFSLTLCQFQGPCVYCC
jgi:hypothetical protein